MAAGTDERVAPLNPKKKRKRPYHPLMPRFWHGMRLSAWLKLLARNRFAVSPSRIPLALGITAITPLMSAAYALETLCVGWKARQTKIQHPPVFILGHWRTGTTLLHELLVRDPRHTYPTTYQCFAPNMYWYSQGLIEKYGVILLPSQRPMDRMPAGWDRPQEDEFALVNMGVPSPYSFLAFPERPIPFREYIDFEGVAQEDVEKWKQTFFSFCRRLTFRDNRRLVLKSPPHTARIRALLELFPDARFIHLVRNPYELFPSTVRMWTALCEVQGLHPVREMAHLPEFVLETLPQLYRSYERDRELIAPNRLIEVRYEDFVADILGTLESAYDQLELGSFEPVRPHIEEYVRETEGYRKNKHRLDDETRQRINDAWADYFDRYGYEREE